MWHICNDLNKLFGNEKNIHLLFKLEIYFE